MKQEEKKVKIEKELKKLQEQGKTAEAEALQDKEAETLFL